ncbi:MAG: hypothetical protein ABIQ00_09435 [Chitinophagaceae bacterium]
MTMIIQEFKNLKDIEKEKVVWFHGKLLTNLTFDNQVCDIYQLFDFYVSLSYDVKNTLKALICSQVYPEMLPIIRNIHKGGLNC